MKNRQRGKRNKALDVVLDKRATIAQRSAALSVLIQTAQVKAPNPSDYLSR